MEHPSKKPLVFITGAFFGNNCWNNWRTYFEGKGYPCIAPSWPHKDATPEELRNRHPDAAMASSRLENLTDHFATITQTLPEKPVLIGHSLGGLIVQILLQRGFAAAGVAIRSFPAGGFSTSTISFFSAMWSPMGFFTSSQKTYMISFRKWRTSVANGMTCQEQKQSFYEYATPESKRLIRDTFNSVNKIDFEKEGPPLLFLSGGCDRVTSEALNFNNYMGYFRSNSITYKNFKNRNHLFFGHQGWEEEADYVLNWLQGLQRK